MVQAYHAVPVSVEHEDADNGPGVEHEGSALLGNSASSSGLAKSNAQNEGHATLTSSVGNLANTIIGSGEFAQRTTPSLTSPAFNQFILSSYLSAYTVCVIAAFRHAHLSSGMFRLATAIRVLSRDDSHLCGIDDRTSLLRVSSPACSPARFLAESAHSVCISSPLVRATHRTAAHPSSPSRASPSRARPFSSTQLLPSSALGYLSGAPVLFLRTTSSVG